MSEQQTEPEMKVSDEEMQAILQRVALWHQERGLSWALVNQSTGIVWQGGQRHVIQATLNSCARISEAEIIDNYIQIRQMHAAKQQAEAEGTE